MPSKEQPPERTRRIPRQERARASVEAIFEATARILQADGIEALNTNAVAERAGVSIGTLYQYFPNKEAILEAMGQRERERIQAEVVQLIMSGPLPGDGSAARLIVRALLAAFGGRQRVRRVVLEALIAAGRYGTMAEPAERIAALLAPRELGGALASQAAEQRAAIFVMTRAVVGVIRAAVLEESPLLGEPAFEDELVSLVAGAMQRLRPKEVGE